MQRTQKIAYKRPIKLKREEKNLTHESLSDILFVKINVITQTISSLLSNKIILPIMMKDKIVYVIIYICDPK